MSSEYCIQIVESFYTGSHKFWADRIRRHSRFEVELNTLPGRHWKWRLSAGCINLAKQAGELCVPDLFVVSSLVDLCGFRSMLRPTSRGIPILYYMHENQLVYPERNRQERDRQYGIMQFKSLIAADSIAFNSAFHRDVFFDALKDFLRAFPDRRNTALIPALRERSQILQLGIDPPRVEIKKGSEPVVLWNHRWEHDKAPEAFFRVLERLIHKGIDFKVVLCGESYGQIPTPFTDFCSKYEERILHKGFADRDTYQRLLAQSNVMPVTSNQEYFGLSVMEAISNCVIPLLPRRLVYPELYGDFPELFYENEAELEGKLMQLLTRRANPKLPDLSAYYWSERIRDFDRCFENTIRGIS